MLSTNPRGLRDALLQIAKELLGFYRLHKTDESTKIMIIFLKVGSVIAWFVGFGLALIKYDREFKDAVLFGTHCALYLPTLYASIFIFTAIALTFSFVKKGVHNSLADRWERRFIRNNPEATSWEYPYYRFEIPAVIVASLFSLVPIAMIPLLGAIVSAFAPYGMPNFIDH